MVDFQKLSLDSYIPVVGSEEIAEIRALGKYLHGASIQHINSTAVGGGVAEILMRLVPLMAEVGLDAHWDVITGTAPFYKVTKAFHNALHGGDESITPEMFQIFMETTEKNLGVIRQGQDFYAMHDPQPVGLVQQRTAKGRWLWRCHIDVSDADLRVWGFLRPFVEKFDGAIFHLADYAKEMAIPQYIVPPAIDPLTPKNMDLPAETIAATLQKYQIDPKRPVVLQVSRFDRLKDPVGVIQAFKLCKRWTDCQLVLAGGSADDDPEGAVVLEEVRAAADKDPDIHILALPPDAHLEINALQRGATLVVQKSLKEGFGLVVTEAMWKAKPVIGGNVGGIRRQIIQESTGYLVNSVEGLAFRMRQLLSNPGLAKRLGENARKNVLENFLLTTYLKQWLTVLHSTRSGAQPIVQLG